MLSETLDEVSLDRVMASRVTRRGDHLVVADEEFDVTSPRRIFVAGIGKAARPMCEALVPLLPSTAHAALVAPDPSDFSRQEFRIFSGGHPYPNLDSEIAASYVLAIAEGLTAEDMFICLLSGGGSAICEQALPANVSLFDLQAFYEVLVTCGANIVEMNILRKHLSRIKGGRLATAAAPARQLTLYVSDVPPGEPSTVASGPTMPDETTCEDAYATAERLGIVSRFPESIRECFEQRTLQETPKRGSPEFARSRWICLLDNFAVLESVEAKARAAGWSLERDMSVDDQPLQAAARALIYRLMQLTRANPGRTVAVTSGGELSSPVTGDGMGGRNQAFVLCAARMLAARGVRATVLSAGTDGIDGNSPAAGAVADHTTVARAEALGMDAEDFEQRSDSYRFFKGLGDLIVTGPTGNNVRDVRILVAEPR